MFLVLLLWSLVATPSFADSDPSLLWQIQKDHWDRSDEKGFGGFVAGLAEGLKNMASDGSCRDTSKPCCHGVAGCLQSAANPYRNSDPANLSFAIDCADLPYFLRAYYAWKNHLPFSMEAEVDQIPPLDPLQPRDAQYSPNGNRITRRTSVATSEKGTFVNAVRFLNNIPPVISSAMYRYPPDLDTDQTESSLFSDFYSPAISRQSIHPGTVVYDPSGHVGIVSEVDKSGRIYFIDAHPDYSLTRTLFNQAMSRSRPEHGAAFKNWRPQVLVGAHEVGGNLVGGKIVGAPNPQIADYSLEQYYGNTPDVGGDWHAGKFIVSTNGNDRKLSFHEYVQDALKLKDPSATEEFAAMLDNVCAEMKDRAAAVNEALIRQLDQKTHPYALPDNIYGTKDSEWESYSTPSRDARFRVSVQELRQKTEDMINTVGTPQSTYVYKGSDLKADLLQIYRQKARECHITYTNSAGDDVDLNLQNVMDRIYDLSFDPYHCVELRWGALPKSKEFSTCPANSEKLRWYAAEFALRNQLERTYDAKMGFMLDELLSGIGVAKSGGVLPAGMGQMQGPDLNVAALLRR